MDALSNEELIELYRKEENVFRKESIRDFFFRKNEKLPCYIASKFKHSSVAFDDLASIACIGMVKAFDKFNVEAGVKFATFASRVMSNEILMQFRKEKKHEKNMSLDGALRVDAQGNEFSLSDILADDSCFELDVEQTSLLQEVQNVAVHILSDKERFALASTFCNKPLSQSEIAEKLNISQSYVSRLIAVATDKIAAYFKSKELGELVQVNVGNKIEWVSPEGITLQGKVLIVNENSVIVDQTVNPNWEALGLKDKTVVSHRKYKIVTDVVVEPNVNGVPGTVAYYQILKNEGLSDSAIMRRWDVEDESVKWHTARFYEWKKANGLVKSQTVKDVTLTVPGVVEAELEEPLTITVEEPKTEVDMLQEAIPDLPFFAEAPTESLIIKVSEEDAQALKEELKTAPAVFTTPVTGRVDVLPDAKLLAENEQLKAELAVIRAELWAERTCRLFAMQAELDALICESNGLQIAAYDTEHILATIVELAEVAQEEQSFKYWKKNKQVDREKLLEETVDVLHFIISRGLQRGIKKVVLAEHLVPRESIAEQMLLIITLLVEFRKEGLNKDVLYNDLFEAFYTFVSLLGFEWAQITAAYEKKHAENIARQKRNY